MKKQFFQSVAVMALMTFAAPVMANDSLIYQGGNCNTAVVGQSGSNWSILVQVNPGGCRAGNEALVLQSGQNGQATGQLGRNNDALTAQDGRGNLSGTLQIGNRNDAQTYQDGRRNAALTVQLGNRNDAQTYQDGRGNLSGTLQIGNRNDAQTYQDGRGNLSGTLQLGNGNNSAIGQDGNGNTAVVVQESSP